MAKKFFLKKTEGIQVNRGGKCLVEMPDRDG